MKNVSDIYPLSPMQEIMLVHALARPENDLLFNQVVYRLEGDLEPALYEQCWQEAARRHPVLRTLFLWEGLKAPVQVVRETAPLEWQNLDWRGLPPAEQETCLAELLQSDRRRGFALNQAPLTRLALCRRAANRYTLVWSSHHLVLDRWCIPILLGETAALYEAHHQAETPSLAPARPFRDYVAWLKQQDLGGAETFWRAELAGINVPAGLTGESPTIAANGYGDQTARLAASKTAALRAFAAAHHLTLSTLVLGAWALLHARATPADDLLLGLTISGRPAELPGVEGMIGSFINNVPLRASFSADQPAADWLRALQARQQAAQGYGYLSPLQIQEWSAAPDTIPLYQTLYLYQSPVQTPAGRIRLEPERVGFQSSFPLTLAVEDAASGLLLWLNYDRRRFHPAAIDRLLAIMPRALDLLAEEPGANIRALLACLRAEFPPDGPALDATAPVSAAPALPDIMLPARQAPRSGLEARLFNLWANILGHQDFGVHDSFFDLGATSFQAVQLVGRIRAAFEQDFAVAALFAHPSIEKLAQALSSGTASPPWSALVPVKPGGRKPPIFLLHHGGGGITGYAKLAARLDPDRPLYGLQEPGIENGQPLPASLDAIVRVYLEEIQSVQPRGPYYLGGFCFGGVVAFEIAQQLQRRGETVDLLLLLDAVKPGAAVSTKLQDRLAVHQARLAGRTLAGKIGYVGYRIGFRLVKEAERLYETVRRRTDRLAFDLLDRFRRPIPSYIRQRRLLELNGQLNDAYVPQPYHGRAALIRGVYPELRYDQDFGWNTVIQPGVQVYTIDTDDHLKMLEEPEKLAVLVQHIRHALDEG